MSSERDVSLLTWALTGASTEAARAPRPIATAAETTVFRAWIAPFLLMVVTPPLAILLWMIAVHHDGSISLFVQRATWTGVLELFPRPSLTAAATVAGWTAAQGALLAFLPGAELAGPVTPAGVRPLYKLNGVASWLVTHGGLLVAWKLGLFRAASLYEHYGELLSTLVVFALLFCVFLYGKGRLFPSSPDAVVTGRPLFDFFQGVELHPTLLGMGLKQLINCRVSMMGWSATPMVFALAQVELTGSLSPGMAVTAFLHLVYLLKFFHWEGGYFYSLDIMHDRFGYYICWGVLAWVPSVYALAPLYLVEHTPPMTVATAVVLSALGVLAIATNYAADLQRRRARDTQGKTTIWGKPPVLLEARYTTADGKEHQNLLLCSGFWGLSRHFHYVPELAAALLWTSPVGLSHALPWFYPFFLAILLFDRAGRDDLRCAKKYGATWDEYKKRVPYRLLPGVY